jgi:phosphopantetheinyl transferase
VADTHIQLMSMRLDVAIHAERERELLPRLAREEQARYADFRAAARRQTWLAGRALLLAALEQALGAAEPAALLTEAHGGPRYTASDLHLNLSHSGGLLVAALAPLPVGVDLERPRERALVHEAARIFCPEEARALDELPEIERLAGFYTLWTLKEAACKAAGLTVWDSLRRACFDLKGGHCRVEPPFPPGPWGFMHGSLEPDWRLALAWQGEAGTPHISCRRWQDGRWGAETLLGTAFLHGGQRAALS